MNLTARLLIACTLVAASQLVVLTIHHGMEPKPAHLPVQGLSSMPETIDDFVGHDEPLDDQQVAGTDAAVMRNRVYRNRLGDCVIANIGIWTRYHTVVPHAPDICYPRAGWDIISRKTLHRDGKDGTPMEIKQFVFQKGTSRVAVAYWVHLGDETFADSERVRQARQRLRLSEEYLPPLVKVMLQIDAQDAAMAESKLSRFIASMTPYSKTIR